MDNDCKLGLSFNPQWEPGVTLLSVLHYTSKQQGEGRGLHGSLLLSSAPTQVFAFCGLL